MNVLWRKGGENNNAGFGLARQSDRSVVRNVTFSREVSRGRTPDRDECFAPADNTNTLRRRLWRSGVQRSWSRWFSRRIRLLPTSAVGCPIHPLILPASAG